MADTEKKKEERAPAPAPAEAPAKKKPPIKMIGIVAGLMAAEGAGVYLFVGMTGSHPKSAEAKVEGALEQAAQEAVEIELVDEKFQNMQTGHVWVWDVAIAIKAKQRNAKYIGEQLEKRAAEISEAISQIFRRAQHSQLIEPELTTINRQIAAYLDTIIKPDDTTGASRVERVIIPKCKGLQID